MSRACNICGRGTTSGNSRSHSNIATKRRQNVNLQTVRINGKRLRISARTLKTIKRKAAEAHKSA